MDNYELVNFSFFIHPSGGGIGIWAGLYDGLY
jgi:hypothetical protein